MIRWADVILILTIGVISVLLWFGFTHFLQTDQGMATILVNGELIGQYDLRDESTVTLSGYSGGYNLLMITGGVADVTDADCPDRFCVRQKSVSRRNESIICLPHRLVVRIEQGGEAEYDVVTY
jgi:hypothetical protein